MTQKLEENNVKEEFLHRNIFNFDIELKGRNRLDKGVELKVQNCRENLQDSFDNNNLYSVQF